jgi:hypothetical protein
MGKAFGLVMNMDQLVGKDFDKGLSQLRSAAEETARAAAEATNGGSADGADAGTP